MKNFLAAIIAAILLIPSGAFALEHTDQGTKPYDTELETLGAVEGMSSGRMNAAHMRMTHLRPKTPEDQHRADQVAAELGAAIEKYKDYHVAEADGYKVFLPSVPQPMYHFTRTWSGIKEAFRFNPEEPTSLLYKKTPNGFLLIGAMYTAPRRWDEDKLDLRIPLSVAMWHQHTNICLPRHGDGWKSDWTKFGPKGSISTRPECDEASGTFYPVIFGWMVHCYPYETRADRVWAH